MSKFKRKPKNKFHKKAPKVNTSPTTTLNTQEVIGMRLNKYVAHCGVCSRRKAAELVKNGEILVNGSVLDNPAYQIQEGDIVTYDGKTITPVAKLVYLLMNKPKGVITTVNDEKGRKTVIDVLKGKVKERVFPVGRLDGATTGLLLLTNDGDLSNKLMHPSNEVTKFYQATLDKPLTANDLEAIRKGLVLEDGPIEVDGVDYVKSVTAKNVVGIELHSGRNRIIRRIFEHLGYTVTALDRVYLAGLTKKDLPRGFFRHLSEREIIMLKHFT